MIIKVVVDPAAVKPWVALTGSIGARSSAEAMVVQVITTQSVAQIVFMNRVLCCADGTGLQVHRYARFLNDLLTYAPFNQKIQPVGKNSLH